MDDEQLEKVTSFKYLRPNLSKNCINTAEVLIRISMATDAMARLSRLWTSSSISFSTT
ncbi:hypothetical protein DPMN_181303 [Dreissena polymorpha]|uniref:Uncharacterized protein n=1 Tax=Dreissena polymorpha TaxID=45954 RepID=A0A9D4DDJ9_DREPO|nr:hypothetical protein DPMN_181303 [Dreissena polymorpha]